ncbi:UvrD-helicase domain-containing protein [Vibrio sp. LaRot3]|uniref:UvrD-helicase domain-containing protein n=1 Tax=Vibrio sp. LaRot3 TaxID=2998829 RepID=UPI0022CE3477|nr:UvrD-helicase domain-containing protein [Vibrio sp. LaRot3]MDA0147155.1 UvrD-helicase domain-containing protein [Vibrio sp. LaRot3]
MIGAITSVTFLVEEKLLRLILDRLSVCELKKLMEIGVRAVGMDSAIIDSPKSKDEFCEAIEYLAARFKEDPHQVNALLAVSAQQLQSFPDNKEANSQLQTRDLSERKINLTSIVTSKNSLNIKANKQQEEIVENCERGIQINAFAGTGKSTTCKLMIDRLGERNSLYTSFLTENRDDARRKITSKRHAHTQDGLAVQYALEHAPFKHIFNYKGNWSAPVYQMKDVIGSAIRLEIGHGRKIQQHGIAKLVTRTLLDYCQSLYSDLDDRFVPNSVINPSARSKILSWSRNYWDYLLSGRAGTEHSATYSHLMKFWSLRPEISMSDDYTNIIVDEAQDINGAFLQVLNNHQDRNINIVGDRYQELFGWRGAINSMGMFGKDGYPLDQSFRFGAAIADASNTLLSKHSEPPQTKIRGLDSVDSKISYFDDDAPIPHHNGAILTRTRAGVIHIADSELNAGTRVHIKTEFGHLKYVIRNIIYLAQEQFDKIGLPYLMGFPSYAFLENELKDNPDPDVYFGMKLYERFGERVLEVIERIEKYNSPESDAMKVISTTHSIKGKEWDYVVISPDYAYVLDNDKADLDAELAVLYVAITRAKKQVFLPSSLKKYFSGKG